MQLRLRFFKGIEQGARSRDVQGVIGRLSARVHLAGPAMGLSTLVCTAARSHI